MIQLNSDYREEDLDFGPTMRGLREGLKMFERYTLVRMLGRGGMGVVWQAHDEKLDLDIALKFLHENLVGDDAALDDLRRETRRCMKLHHTNIVQVYDLVDDPGSAAIAMEFIDGRPFSALRMDKPSRVLDTEDLLPLLEQVCAALSYAHETAKIVHHDLKPGNLMLTRDGIVKVMDFGIASSLSDSMSRNSRVGQQSSSGSGTLPYMSPQQLMGFPPSVADDVYSLGATLYELLSSKPPFFRGELTRQIESISPPTIRERRVELEIEGAAPVPEVWEQTIAACLEKEAEKRPQSVRELMARLTGQELTTGPAAVHIPTQRVAANPVTTGPAAICPSRPNRKPLLISLAAVLCLGGALGWWFGMEAPKRAEAARVAHELRQQEAARKAQEVADAAVAARLAREKDETARIAMEKADAEEKQRAMTAQLKRQRLQREEEMKKLAGTNDFNTAQIGDTRLVDLGSGVKMILCYVPAGSFTMGSPAGEADRSDDEDQVQVRITQGYWLAKTECTQAQWRAVMGSEPSHFKGDDMPLEKVSWGEAQDFMAKLNGKKVLPVGWKWSLPTEAQWEYACRAGTTTPYAGELERMAWYSDNSGSKTHPVGTKAANAWGLYDMHGNVYEWCSDWYDAKLPGGTDPTGASSGSDRVGRGGSWVNGGQGCRSAFRGRSGPGFHNYGIFGFRAASVPAETESRQADKE